MSGTGTYVGGTRQGFPVSRPYIWTSLARQSGSIRNNVACGLAKAGSPNKQAIFMVHNWHGIGGVSKGTPHVVKTGQGVPGSKRYMGACGRGKGMSVRNHASLWAGEGRSFGNQDLCELGKAGISSRQDICMGVTGTGEGEHQKQRPMWEGKAGSPNKQAIFVVRKWHGR